MTTDELRDEIETLFKFDAKELPDSAGETFTAFRNALSSGTVRAATPSIEGWQTNAWVKKGILVGFRVGRSERTVDAGPLGFVDKHTLPTRRFDDDEGVRIVPGGSSIREGAYIGRDVVCMPPMYVNIGAYIDDGTLIDSHALVGSCAQIGKKV
ncbi:MAG: 2,3,4,5-tetrahydropyridine-2,6-dicarboxylate N-succinyltransferase, partial [Acidobacteria bacterium]|nr:2,3,4,5-tetrahydropyridine-2,6-dicarboxylate N-succinyltransferase [Acidobacteriota bacterium]